MVAGLHRLIHLYCTLYPTIQPIWNTSHITRFLHIAMHMLMLNTMKEKKKRKGNNNNCNCKLWYVRSDAMQRRCDDRTKGNAVWLASQRPPW